MNRKELVGAVAVHTGMDGRDIDRALKGLTEVIEAVAAKGEQVTIMGFAKFARVDRPARMARNPATGAAVKVKASKKAKITPLKGFKDAVMSPSVAPKLAKGVWPASAAKVPAKAGPVKGGEYVVARARTKATSAEATPAAKATGTRKVATTKKAPTAVASTGAKAAARGKPAGGPAKTTTKKASAPVTTKSASGAARKGTAKAR